MKHALAEEGAAETDPVQSADEVVILPDLDTVAMSELVQPDVELADALVDPGVVAAGLRRGAASDHGFECRVDGDGEGVGSHRARQAGGNTKAIERYNAAHFRRDFGSGGVARRHGREDSRVEAVAARVRFN